MPKGPIVPVESSSIAAVGYDDSEKTLHVEFRTGAVYVFEHVRPNVFVDLLSADSKGRFFNVNIRDAFPFQRIR